ncbi:MAG: hypothetical protein ACPGYT_07155 [Nitrospirales bacterium]
MPKTLYILTQVIKKDQGEFPYVQPNQEQDGRSFSHVFIQEGRAQQDHMGECTYVVEDNEKFLDIQSTFESISYHELLGLIFGSDNVVVI